MKKLVSLDLSENKITEINALGRLTSLKTLHLDANEIEDFEPLYKLTSLTTLSISNMKIGEKQLKELKEAGRIAAYEVQENAVVLYWRGLAPRQTAQVPLALTAAIPGEYTAAASRAYLYYDDQAKQYQPGVAAKIAPKER